MVLQQPLVTHCNKPKPHKPCIAVAVQSPTLSYNTTQIHYGMNNDSD